MLEPSLRWMRENDCPFTGLLYAGLMITPANELKVLEFNCRMGDPETQPIMMRLKSDLVEVFLAATDGTLDQVELQWDRRFALGVVMAAGGSDALEWDSERSKDGKSARDWLRTKGNSIEGGTSEIQLNIVAKHILGLPGA